MYKKLSTALSRMLLHPTAGKKKPVDQAVLPGE
jgi:hypothetical protein